LHLTGGAWRCVIQGPDEHESAADKENRVDRAETTKTFAGKAGS